MSSHIFLRYKGGSGHRLSNDTDVISGMLNLFETPAVNQNGGGGPHEANIGMGLLPKIITLDLSVDDEAGRSIELNDDEGRKSCNLRLLGVTIASIVIMVRYFVAVHWNCLPPLVERKDVAADARNSHGRLVRSH